MRERTECHIKQDGLNEEVRNRPSSKGFANFKRVSQASSTKHAKDPKIDKDIESVASIQ